MTPTNFTEITDATFARIFDIVLSLPGHGLRVVHNGGRVLVGPEGGAMDAEFEAREGANDLTSDEIRASIEFAAGIPGGAL